MIETTITRDYSKVKFLLGIALILTVSIVGTVYAFGNPEAAKIGAISKKMAEVTTDISMAEIKLAELVTERDQIDQKVGLVQNHIDTQNGALNSYKQEIEQIINPDKKSFTQTEK